jgi:hypothetical protein
VPSLFLIVSLLSCIKPKLNPETVIETSLGSQSEVETTAFLFIPCGDHSDCFAGLFCGIECWTGQCGVDGSVVEYTFGQYCQPCVECELDSDSVSGSCDICGDARVIDQ